jgi:intein/homing endonuclease
MKEHLVYTAGLIDGEGTIALLRGRSSDKFRHPVVSVTNTSRELIDFLHQTFGGVVVTQKTYKLHHKPSWSWKITYDHAIEFIQQIRPFMKESSKCKRCDMILSTYKSLTHRNGKYTTEQIQAKLDFETTFLSS